MPMKSNTVKTLSYASKVELSFLMFWIYIHFISLLFVESHGAQKIS